MLLWQGYAIASDESLSVAELRQSYFSGLGKQEIGRVIKSLAQLQLLAHADWKFFIELLN